MTKYVHVTDNSVTKEQMIRKESCVLASFSFQMTFPTVLDFYEHFLLQAGLGILPNEVNLSEKDSSLTASPQEKNRRRIISLGRYLIELQLLDFSFNSYKPSLVACSAIITSLKLFKHTPYWPPLMQQTTGYQESDLKMVTTDMIRLFEQAANNNLTVIYKKFQHFVYEGISLRKITKKTQNQPPPPPPAANRY